METFSVLLALCAENSPVTHEFPLQRPVTQSFDVFFDLRLNKRLRKQSWGWWFETPSRSSWRHSNDIWPSTELFFFQKIAANNNKTMRCLFCWPFVMGWFPVETSSNGNVLRVTGHLCGEFTGIRGNSPHKGQWRGDLMFSLICTRINCWVNNVGAGDLRRHRAHRNVLTSSCLFGQGTMYRAHRNQ